MTRELIRVRFTAGTHQTNTIRGKRASSTSSYVQAAVDLAKKLYPGAAVELKRLGNQCKTGTEVFEVVAPAVPSQVVWISDNVERPDADSTVLVELVGDAEPVWLGFWDGAVWRDACTGAEFDGQVVAWADRPKGSRQQ